MRIFWVTLLLAGWLPAHAQSYSQAGHLDFNQGVAAANAGNYAVAYCIWKPLADLGHAEAQYRLGWLYAKGLGLAVSESAAIHWWQLAANLGHADALFRLGWAYEHGEGTDRDIARAIEYYLAAASHGQEDAKEILQLMMSRDNREVAAGVARLLEKNPDAIGERAEIQVERANVRKAGNKHATLLRTLKQGDPLVVLGNRGNWLRIWMVEYQQFGWIFNRLVSGYQ